MRELNAKTFIEKRISKKNGGEYWVMVTKFANGYEIVTFLTSDQVFILTK